MLMLELLFPMVLMYLPERSGQATIIAIVMLGLGLGGLIYYLLHDRPHVLGYTRAAVIALPLFILAGFFVAALVPGQAAAALCLALPFALISFFLSRGFVLLPAGRTYFVNLGGSAAGAGMIFLFHPRLGEENGILVTAVLAGIAALFLVRDRRGRATAVVPLLIAAALLALNLVSGRLDLINLIPSSRLHGPQAEDAMSFAFRAARDPGAKRLGVSHNLVSRVDAIAVPGYDLAARYFSGGLAAVPDPELRADLAASLAGAIKLYYNDRVWSQVVTPEARFSAASPYTLLDKPSVLVIGPGGGVDLARAASHHAQKITAVEINPGVIELMRGPLHDPSGGVYDQALLICMDGRTFVRLSRENFDLIHLAFADLYVPLLNSDIFLENYLYTVEAFQEDFQHLTPQGMIAVYKWVRSGRWNKDLFRIAATARAMLEAEGVSEPGSHLFIAGMEGTPDQYLGYFLIRKTPFTVQETAALAAQVRPPFEIYFAPGLPVKPNPFADIIQAPDLKGFLAQLPYDVSPTTDDRPLFYLFDRDLTYHRHYFSFYLLVIAVAIVLPIGIISVRERLVREPRFYLGAVFFIALGIGYMFLQTTMLQKFNLFLGSPILSLALVITAFLCFSGLGALLAPRLPRALHYFVLPLIAAMTFLYAFRLDAILALVSAPSIGGRGAITVLLLAPLSFALGLPFPRALEQSKQFFGERRAALFFAVNGAAGSFAVAWFTLLVAGHGLHQCFLLAGLFYLLAAVIYPAFARGPAE